MVDNSFVYKLFLYRDDGSLVGERTVTPDLVPAREQASFGGMRRGSLPPTPAALNYVIQPNWHPKVGRPFLSGFNVAVSDNGVEKASAQFPSRYFDGLAQEAADWHMQQGRMKAGERFWYLIAALPVAATAPGKRPLPTFTVGNADPPLRLKEGADLAQFRSASVPFGAPSEEDVPVFIPRSVLAEAVEVARRSGTDETGGLLIGRLHRDMRMPEIFLEITSQIAADHAVGQAARLTFTSETWTAARAAIASRRSDELMLAWYHSHPFAPSSRCKDCEKRKDRTCSANSTFFSSDDVAVHRAVFPRAYSVALVIGSSDCTGLTYALFGWGKYGTIVQRGFHILEGASCGAETRAGANGADQSGGTEHASD